jgi:hypothetical protein
MDPKKLSRRTDPQTSHDAAEAIVGKLKGLHQWVLSAVIEHPGKTCKELSKIYKLDDNRKVGRRLSELEKRGLIKTGEDRPCSITGFKVQTWWPVSKAETIQEEDTQLTFNSDGGE